MEDATVPDLRDIELKLGRKVPESLVRSLRGEEPVPLERIRDPCGGSSGGGGGCSSSSSCCSLPPSLSSSSSSSPASGSPGRRSHSSTLERLETKLHLLRQEMVSAVRQRWAWGPPRQNAEIGAGKVGPGREGGEGCRGGFRCVGKEGERSERTGGAGLEAAAARLVYPGLCSVHGSQRSRACSVLCTLIARTWCSLAASV